MNTSSTTVLVRGCARCGQDHVIKFIPFTNPPEGIFTYTGVSYERYALSHFGTCENTKEPVLMNIKPQ